MGGGGPKYQSEYCEYSEFWFGAAPVQSLPGSCVNLFSRLHRCRGKATEVQCFQLQIVLVIAALRSSVVTSLVTS